MRNNPKKAPKITLYIYWIFQKLGDSLRERNPDQQKIKVVVIVRICYITMALDQANSNQTREN